MTEMLAPDVRGMASVLMTPTERVPALPALRAPGPRVARILVQVLVLAFGLFAVRSGVGLLPSLVVAQAVTGFAVYAAYRWSRPPTAALGRTARVWGVGAGLSLALTLGLEALGAGGPLAQVGAVALTVGLLGLGRLRDSYVAAGLQLDAILATLPPPATAGEGRV